VRFALLIHHVDVGWVISDLMLPVTPVIRTTPLLVIILGYNSIDMSTFQQTLPISTYIYIYAYTILI
jgi:hypothetical protein